MFMNCVYTYEVYFTQETSSSILDDRVARKQVGGREQIEGKKSEVTEDE